MSYQHPEYDPVYAFGFFWGLSALSFIVALVAVSFNRLDLALFFTFFSGFCFCDSLEHI